VTTTPDGIEVVATRADAERLALPPLLVLESLTEYLDSQRIGTGDIAWERIGDGQSNITYRITRGDESLVLRRGPRPPHPRSTHDMLREARIQRLVGDAGVAVPRIVATCDDESVLGVPFYLMGFLDGIVITDSIPRPLDSPEQRRATAFAAVDTLVDLHRVDVSTGELATFGRPEGYLARQVKLFSSLWTQNTTRSIPEVEALGLWLGENLPESRSASVVHGDFRIGNLMFASNAPASVVAILDWEMATIGDPLADLGYLTATYATADAARTPMELTSVTREPGYPGKDELIARYQEQLPVDVGALPWYQALALWKAAIFCEAMYTRWLHGERPGDTFAPTLELGIPALVEAAGRFSGELNRG
jgi:aminoglycoside phosphotransferase (APT) family kinase protein